MMSKLTNAHKCVKAYHTYTHRVRPTRFGHSYGHFQGDALQRTDTSKYDRGFWTST